ncbi:hypothetical protein H4R19_004991 [Coemansia spiralis]|nr:hypothetical protein H4R19_004991 [Coemansia spiralis]
MDQGHLFVSPGHSTAFQHHQPAQPPPMPAMSHSASDPSSAQSPASDSPSSAVTPGNSAADLGLTLSHQQHQHQHQQHQAGASGPAGQQLHQHSQGRPRSSYADADADPASQQQQYTQLPPTSSLPQPAYSSAFSSAAPQPHSVHPGGSLYQASQQGHVQASAQYRQHDQAPALAPLQLSQLGVIGGQRPPSGFPYEFDPSDGSCRGLYSADMDPSNSAQPAPLTTNGYIRHGGSIPVAPGHPQASFAAPHTQHPLDMASAAAAANISLPVDMGGDQNSQSASLHASATHSSFGGSPTSSQPFMATLNFQHAQLHDYDSYSRPPKRTGRTAKPKRTPRPPNAFILYRKAKQAEVIRDNPGVSNKDVSCIIGQMWKAEDPAVQDKYRELAEIEKKKHKEMHPNYKYQPRKPKNKRLQESQAAANAAAAAANGALMSGGAQDGSSGGGGGGGSFSGGLPVTPGGALPSGIKDQSVSSASAGFSPYPKYHMMMHSGHGQTPQSVHSQPPQHSSQHAQQQLQSQAAHQMSQHQQAHLACSDEYYYRNAASIHEQHQHHVQQQQQQQQQHAGGGFVGVPTQLDIKPSFMGGVPAAAAAYWTPATPSDAAFSNTLPSGNVFHGSDQAAAAAAAAAHMRSFDSVVPPHPATAGHPSATPMFHPFDHQRQGQPQPGSQPSMHDGHADYQTSQAHQYHQHHAAHHQQQQQQPPHSAPALGSYVNSGQAYHHPQQGMDALDGSSMAGADSQGLGLLSPPTVAWSNM